MKGAFKFLHAEPLPSALFAMADHKESALPPPRAAVPVVEPSDVPTPAAEPEVILVVMLSILLSVGCLASMGFGLVCLSISPSPVSLLFQNAFKSFNFCRLAECLATIHMYFGFFLGNVWLTCPARENLFQL